MNAIIYYLEKNLDRFEKIYSKGYATRKGYKHNKFYFDVQYKFTSDDNEFIYEAALMMALMEPPTANGFIYHKEGSFDCMFIYKGRTQQEVLEKIISKTNEDEAIYQKENS